MPKITQPKSIEPFSNLGLSDFKVSGFPPPSSTDDKSIPNQKLLINSKKLYFIRIWLWLGPSVGNLGARGEAVEKGFGIRFMDPGPWGCAQDTPQTW